MGSPFQQYLIDHDILPDDYEYPDDQLPPDPENIDEIMAVISQPRQSLSPSQLSRDGFRKFKRADAHGTKENAKTAASDVLFNHLDSLTDDTIVPAKPDVYYGARPEQFDRKVRKDLNGHTLPSTQHNLPDAPNFFLDAKGPDESLSVATRQVRYVGALGAKGIHTLQSYENPEPEYDNKAYTLT
ncbi:hypothetical protein QQS21_005655 [Conoideocrella luteorostrata]|uniref:Uncharacterized protein n=1 Tax=Conoideocrella luteorostrata TaxID=1105319 RepID=A0AAJ0CP25_9HYPO|nr:hypothetical protein QQS21_005655 [Conoideocrella luteorostrata]